MKVVLIRPPKVQGSLEKDSVQQPINIASIAAYLRGHGHNVEIWDYEVEPFSESRYVARIRASDPQIVGFTSMTGTILDASAIASVLKRSFPDIVTVVGGPHVTALPERSLDEFPAFDVVVIGEGEETMRDLCARIEQGTSLEGIPGIAYRLDGEIHREERRPLIKDLDTLPYPARDLLDLPRYAGASTPGLYDYRKGTSTELFTSRGCGQKCIFCAMSVVFQHKVRFRSPEHVLGEVKECRDRYGYLHFTIEDDTFAYGTRRLEMICRGLGELGVTWDCDCRVDVVTPEKLALMARTGCKKISYGVESGSPRIMKLNQKGITVDQVLNAFRWTKEAGIICQANFIVGSHPDETMEDIRMSEKLMRQISPDLLFIAPVIPFPGTRLYTMLKEKGYIGDEHWAHYDCIHGKPTWRLNHFTGEELVKIQRNIFLKYYTRPRYLLTLSRRMLTWKGFKYYMWAGYRLLWYLFVEKRK